MALHINTQIGTDKGITSDGYLRIEEIDINAKTGVVRVRPTLYMSPDAAVSASGDEFDPYNPSYTNNEYTANNHLVEREYKFSLTSSVVREREFTRVETVSSSYEEEIVDVANPNETITETRWTYANEIVSGTEEYTVAIVDNSAITGSSVYAFTYPLLKYELGTKFGFDNIDDI